MVLTGVGGSSVVFYLSAAVAFTLEDNSAVTAGTIVPQSNSTFNNSTFSGSYQGGSLQAVRPGVTVEADCGSADGNGNLSLNQPLKVSGERAKQPHSGLLPPDRNLINTGHPHTSGQEQRLKELSRYNQNDAARQLWPSFPWCFYARCRERGSGSLAIATMVAWRALA
jgi:hypothetical protein